MERILNPYFYASNPQLLAYENAWIEFVKNDVAPLESIISADIRESWERSRRNGIDPVSRESLGRLSDAELKKKHEMNRNIIDVAVKYMHTIYDIVKKSGVTVDLFDGDGFLLLSLCSSDLTELAKKTNGLPGCNRSEEVAGTNAIALALKTKKAVQTSGAQNYRQQFHNWTFSAAPILRQNGTVLGVINVAGNYETVHEHTLGMVSAVARAVENELHIQKINKELASNNEQRQTLLSMVTDGVIYSIEGVIQQVNQEMCVLLGMGEKELIGKKMEDVVRTTPNINKILKSEGREYDNKELVLEGKTAVYNCLFDVRRIDDAGLTGELFLVTRVDEIRSLAERITNVAEATFNDIISVSSIMQSKIEIARKAAAFNSRVLIQGESGTGKEVMAQAIHNSSMRRYNSFVAIDCGAIPKELFESEMFGYVKGAFTGAKNEGKIGLLELADKGTVFLDEVGNMPLEMQAKLLRVLQEGSLTKVGSVEKVDVDIRVIAATNVDLKKAVSEGTFREDLYYRLNVINIEIPPLRERREDIPKLIDYFLHENISKKGGVNRKITVAGDAMDLLMSYDWPGNIRQLQNFTERLVIMSSGSVVTTDSLPLEIRNTGNSYHVREDSNLTLDEMIYKYVSRVIDEYDGNISKAASALGISRATIYNRLKKK